MPDAIDQVFVAGEKEGYDRGEQDGYDNGYSAGEKEVYDKFWDSYQNNGKRTNYYYGFAGNGWNDQTFKPKYKLKPKNASSMFRRSQITQIDTNTFDFSKATSADYCFDGATKLTSAVVCLLSVGDDEIHGLFKNAKALERVYIAVGSRNMDWTNVFQYCYSLENISILFAYDAQHFSYLDVIGNDIDLSHSTKLPKIVLTRLIGGLRDKSKDTSKTWLFKIGPTNMAKLTETEIAEITQRGWTVA